MTEALLADGAALALPIVLPLLAAGLLIVLPQRHRWQRLIGAAANIAVLAVAVLLIVGTADGTVVSQNVGGWIPGVAIVLASDHFSALLIGVTALLVLLCLIFAAATRDDRHQWFTPLALVMSAGVYGAYLTADLFNLFVFIEVMLAPSYILVVLAGGRRRLAAGRLYVTVSLLASTVFLIGLGLLYGTAGTVNLGDLAGAAVESTLVAVAGAVLLVAMAIKAAMVPLHTWLPRVYPNTSPAVTALFSGLLTKVAVYVIMRVFAVMYDGIWQYGWIIMAAALLSMVIGAIGAVGEETIRAILVFSMVSHIGFILVGSALSTPLGLAAAIFYLVQYVLAKAALLMCAGAVETTYRTSRLERLGGLVTRTPMLALAFMVAALSLAGVPPMSGFVAKLLLAWAAIDDTQYLVGGLVVAVGLVTLLAMVKIWNGAFWGHENEVTWEEAGEEGARRMRRALIAPALVLAGFSVVLGIGAQPLIAAAETAAAGLVNPVDYVAAVTGR